jgi:tRNA-2-methylthio-N6-dimethylallyladenosine synthase
MSSHPKDATEKLFDTMADCSHVAKQLHLPVQSGSNRILKEMNRRYTREQYLEEIRYAREKMPDIVLTSDVIIGFPGETEEEAKETIALVEKVKFAALFTFIYSPRPGTKAAGLPDPVSRGEKQIWFDELLEVQNGISAGIHQDYAGKTVLVLADGESRDEPGILTARTEGNRLVRFRGDKSLVGKFLPIRIVSANTWSLYGEYAESGMGETL